MQTSQLFEEYKKDFIDNINKLEGLTLGEQFNPKDLETFQKLIKSTKLLTKHISVELCSLGNKKAKQINEELKPYKDKFRVFEKKLQKILSQRSEDYHTESSSDFTSNTRETVKQLEENDRLGECKKLLYEMEDISGEVSTNLKNQTDKMQRSKQKLFDTGKYISKANSLLDIMVARERRRQSIACMTVAGAVLLVFGLKYCCY